ncbi:MAG TPA: hypothetical protein PKZ32_18945 [Candidatus Melainabacteria bacterium]|nr:hypothetical protein [Candidatus Melainabacteria bacterium]
MKKLVAATLSVLALSAATVAPAFAGDDNPVVKALMLPVKVVAFGTTAVVGTPVAVVRMSAKNSCESTKSIAGDKGNPLVTGMAALAGVPFGIFTGTLEGSYYGMKNAAMNTDKPFSKDAFSLGDLDE